MPSSLTRLRLHQPGMAGARMPAQRPRVIIYARVSKDQREGRSVDQQIKLGRQIASEHGWEIVGVYSDNDQSASQFARGAREDWEKVVEAILAGEADILWLWELSRGTRDRIVWAHLVEACQDHRMYICLDEDLWDTTNPDHMAYLDDQMVRSIHESGKTRKRIMRDQRAHAEEGKPHGYAHFAYEREYDPKTGALVRQVLHPERSALVLEIVDRIMVGKESRTAIAGDLNRRGIRTPRGLLQGETRVTKTGREIVTTGWSATTIRQLLSSPSLMGRRGYNGRVITDGGWEGVLSEAEWHALQKQLSVEPELTKPGRPRSRPGAVNHLLSGLALCDVCGAVLYAYPASRKSPPAYRCKGLGVGTPKHGSRSIALLDQCVETLVVIRMAHPDVRSALVPRTDDGAVGTAQAKVAEIEAELKDLERALERGETTWRVAAAAEKGLMAQLETAQAAARPPVVDPLIEELLTESEASEASVKRVWDDWELPQKRAALRSLAPEIRMRRVGQIGRRVLRPEEHVLIHWAGVGVGPAV